MNRSLVWTIGALAAAAIIGSVVVMAELRTGAVFIAGDKPVTEEQIRQKLQAEGWTNIQVTREGHYFEAVASKNGQSSKIDVDSRNGRLRPFDDDDD